MPKYFLQDMVKIKRVNHETQIPQEKVRLETALPVKNPARNATPNVARPHDSLERVGQAGGQASGIRYTLWFVAIISIMFFLFALSYLFLNAVVTVNPKMQDLTLNENLSANKGTGVLPFDLVVLSGEEEKTVAATEEKDVSEKAKGIVLIYNTFSSASQRLSVDTRLEGSNGKIYKTEKQIIVPGMKGNTPGSIEVGIYGTEAGEEYNSGPLDFSIFGFKGTSKYSKFYARSKGKIVGGFKGKASIISDTEKLATINDLKTTLKEKLFKKAVDQIPSGFILFKDAVYLDIDDKNIDLTSSKDSMLPIVLEGTLYGLLFDEQKLSKKIAENSINQYDGSDLYMTNIRDLTFSLISPANKDNISFADVNQISFNLSGATKIVWKLDESKLIADLFGKSKKDFKQILLQYPNIDSANLSISPFWRRSLPDKIKDIKVIVNYPK